MSSDETKPGRTFDRFPDEFSLALSVVLRIGGGDASVRRAGISLSFPIRIRIVVENVRNVRAESKVSFRDRRSFSSLALCSVRVDRWSIGSLAVDFVIDVAELSFRSAVQRGSAAPSYLAFEVN